MVNTVSTPTYEARIVKTLNRLGSNGTENPDAKHNTGNLLGTLFLWKKVQKYAESMVSGTLKTIADSGLVADGELSPGDHELVSSPHFVYTAKVSLPVRRFSIEKLAELLETSKYKVPSRIVKELCEAAKVPTTSTVTKTVIER